MKLDKQTQALLDDLAAQAGDIHDIEISIETSREGARAMFLGLAGEIDAQVSSQDLHIEHNGIHVGVRCYRPAQSLASPSPAVVFVHGGGWSLGDVDCYDGLVKDLCQQSGVVFFSVEYSLAPEHKFPCALQQVIAVVDWLQENHQQLELDPTKISLMGDSAGGNLALVAAHNLHQQQPNTLSNLYLVYPVVDSFSPHETYPSRMLYGDGNLLLTRDAIKDTCDWYLAPEQSAANVNVSPLFIEDMTHLPATSVLLAGCDPLYDEGMLLAKKLKQAGVLNTLTCFENTIHAFFSFAVLDVCKLARSNIANQLKHDLT